MNKLKSINIQSKLLHSTKLNTMPSMPIVPAISHAAAYSYENPQALSEIYQNKAKGFTYARTGSPTLMQLEDKITAMEQGIACVCFSTGMAAYDALFFTLFNSGDHIIASKFLFANTISLLKSYSQRFGLQVSYVDVSDINQVIQAKKINTKFILVETIANPCTQIPQLQEIGIFAQENNLVYIVDNTMTSPALFIPKTIDASLVIHSLTKSMSGHSRALGGAIIDTGLFNWSNSNLIENAYKDFGIFSYIIQLRKKGLRDKGATLTANQADLIAIGLETLFMRSAVANENAIQVANFLHSHSNIKSVLHPSLAHHLNHEYAKKYFSSYGSLIAFTLKDEQKPFEFLAKLQIIINCSSIGDNRSLIIHPASTIFAELSRQERQEMGIEENTFRLSIGIENICDLIDDLNQALV